MPSLYGDRSSYSLRSSSAYSSSSATSRPYSSAVSAILSTASSASSNGYGGGYRGSTASTTYGRRYGRGGDWHQEEQRRKRIEAERQKKAEERPKNGGRDKSDDDGEEDQDDKCSSTKKKKKKTKSRLGSTVLNGNVIRIAKGGKVINKNGKNGRDLYGDAAKDTSDEEEEDSTDDDEEEKEDSKPRTPTPPPRTPTPPPPPPEDPLDVEERNLNAQLTLSLTLTMTDEENIRQRLLEIKKSRIKKQRMDVERDLIDKFDKKMEELASRSKAREEEEKILLKRLTAEEIREVEMKDVQVRLQELFRDRKTALEVTHTSMQINYESLVQETNNEMNALDGSIKSKQAEIDALQEQVLALRVHRELLDTGVEKIGHRWQEQQEQLGCQRKELEDKMSEYAVLAPPPCQRQSTALSKKQEELKELEEELECPVCMDISRPPIYQCEEGHIICSACKPLLTTCPHCSKSYSNPVIRCRFAEKLSEKYFRLVDAVSAAAAAAQNNGTANDD